MRTHRAVALRVVLAWTAIASAAPGLLAASPSAAPPAVPPGGAIAAAVDEQVWRAPIAPGVSLVAVRRLDADGWVDLFAVVADLDRPGVSVDVIAGPSLTDRQPTSAMARAAGAVAAINGDFFYLGATGAPAGLVVKGGRLWKGPYPGRRPSVAVVETAEGPRAYVGYFRLDAALTVVESPEGHALASPGRIPVDALNEPALSPGQVGAFDAAWGPAPLPLARWPATEVAHAVLTAPAGRPGYWMVTQVGQGPPPAAPAPGTMVLLGWRQGASVLRSGALRPGAVATFEARVAPQDPAAVPPWAAGRPLRAALSGGAVILRDGQVVSEAGQPGEPQVRHPRSALGVGREGRRLVLVAVDGRRATSRGMDVVELGAWLRRLGVTDAVNLDGGGSTTLVAQLAGPEPSVVNRPAGGEERPVPVAVGVFYSAPKGPGPAPLVLRPSLPVEALLPDLDGYLLGREGLVAAAGAPARIESYPPADPAGLVWLVDPPDLGFFAEPGVFVGLRPGRGRIVALRAGSVPDWAYAGGPGAGTSGADPVATLAGAMQGELEAAQLPVEVIGRPVALQVRPDPIRLAPDGSARLSAWVVDAEGRRAPVHPADVTFWLTGGAEGTVRDGTVTARPFRSADPPVVEARFFGLRASVAIEWVGDGTGDGPGADSLTQRRPAAAAPAGVAGPPPDGGPSGDGTARIAVLGSLPTASGEPRLVEWMALARPHLVAAVARPAAPGEPAAPALARLARPGWPVVAALPHGPDAPRMAEFVGALGSPNAVATRSPARVLALSPSTVSWEWVAAEVRRAMDSRSGEIRCLVVLVPSSPLHWPSRREGEMLLAWLSFAARAGLESWVVYGGEALVHSVVEGVHLLEVPPLGGDGLPVLLRVGPSGVAVVPPGEFPIRPASGEGAPPVPLSPAVPGAADRG